MIPGKAADRPMDGKNIIFCSITSLHEVGRIYGFLLDAHKKDIMDHKLSKDTFIIEKNAEQ